MRTFWPDGREPMSSSSCHPVWIHGNPVWLSSPARLLFLCSRTPRESSSCSHSHSHSRLLAVGYIDSCKFINVRPNRRSTGSHPAASILVSSPARLLLLLELFVLLHSHRVTDWALARLAWLWTKVIMQVYTGTREFLRHFCDGGAGELLATGARTMAVMK